VVVIPDNIRDLASLAPTIDELRSNNTPFRIDPIIEPIGFGFAASLSRYFECRRRWPDAEMLMGIGNLTELSEVDSSGMNLVFAAICQELGIHSILTTEVINWCRSAVAEFDVARRLARHAITNRVLPKHVDSRLVMLRDSRVIQRSEDELVQLQSQLTDPNFRVFAALGEIHVMNRDGYWHDADPYALFDQVLAETKAPDATHAFYLGYELSKARTALTLGKNYVQDQALDWGLLTVDEVSAHERRKLC
ncbi:MAG: dihydropteroate synthase, partial [Planctomycetota bacterium]|nr:dihydropteroate synthase [Planctomycetota bacterium]